MLKIKDILMYIALGIIVLPILFFSDIFNVNAYTLDDNVMEALSNVNYFSQCHTLVLYTSNSDDYLHFACSLDYRLNARSGGNDSIPLQNTNFQTNFYDLTNVYSNTGTSSRYREMGYYNGSSWVSTCTPSNCPYSFNNIKYIVALFENINSNNYDSLIYLNPNTSNYLFTKNYNLNFYEPLSNYFTQETGWFYQPSSVLGSTLDFSGTEESANILGLNDSKGLNHYVYSFNNITSDDTLISQTYNYDNIDLTGNYELGFILTTKRFTDSSLIVHAVTDTNTYACNVTGIKESYDIYYQWYVNCPSVPFDNTETFKIVVNGGNEYYNLVGPVQYWKDNYLFSSSNNNKYVGISSIARKRTDTPPVPVEPDTPSEPDINESINNMNNNIMDPSGPDTSSLANSAGWLPAGPVDSIINLPITMLQSLNNVLSGSSCSPISIPIPFINYNYSLPCISTIISNMGFSTWWEWVGTIASAFILYKYLINLYAWVDKTLTFRENNWNDWGGI